MAALKEEPSTQVQAVVKDATESAEREVRNFYEGRKQAILAQQKLNRTNAFWSFVFRLVKRDYTPVPPPKDIDTFHHFPS
jgi:hypothetical protein